MGNGIERRASRRFTMNLPLLVRTAGPNGAVEQRGQTRDVSFRGLYFMIEARLEPGNEIEFILTLPKEITQAGDVHIRCFGQVVRVEEQNGSRGVAARIERDAKAALEELKEDAVLPHPVRLRDMIMRTKLDAGHALDLNREFQNYLSHFGETQKIARDILEKLAVGEPKTS